MADKITVETTGDFGLQEPQTLEMVSAFSPSTVTNTTFIQKAIAEGKLKEVGKKEEAPVAVPPEPTEEVEAPVVPPTPEPEEPVVAPEKAAPKVHTNKKH